MTLTFQLEGGAFDDRSLVVTDATIADGAASFEIWQGNRLARAKDLCRHARGRRDRPERAPEVALGAPTGRYERLRIERSGPRTINVTMRETPTPLTASGGSSSGGSTTGGSTTGGTTQPQPKPPTKPKRPAYDVG